MKAFDTIVIHVDAETVYHAAADIESWPEIMPHYRWVRVIERSSNGMIAELAVKRGWIPLKWKAVQLLDPENKEVFYRHIEGTARGMAVIWQIEQHDDGTHVSIMHEFSLMQPVLGSFIGKALTGWRFVKVLSYRTLLSMKEELEKRAKTTVD